MNAQETLEFWRKKLNSEDAVKRQLSDSFCNSESKEETDLLNEIHTFIYKDGSDEFFKKLNSPKENILLKGTYLKNGVVIGVDLDKVKDYSVINIQNPLI